jgi:hypothetical protein
LRLSSVALALAGFTAVAPAFAWSPSEEAKRSLARGEAWAEVLASSEGAALIHAVVDIPAAPRTVWAVMTDCKLAFRMIGNLESCKVVHGDQSAGWDIREQVTRGNLFLPDIRNVVRSDYQPYSSIRFRKAGGDLAIEDGEWRLEALPSGGTRVTYVNRVKANILAPSFVVREGMRSSTPKVLLALRKESVAAARSE